MAAKKDPAMRPTDASVDGFLARVPGEQRRELIDRSVRVRQGIDRAST